MKFKKGDLVHFTTNCAKTDSQKGNDRSFLLVTHIRDQFNWTHTDQPIGCVYIDTAGKPLYGKGREVFFSENELKLVYSPD